MTPRSIALGPVPGVDSVAGAAGAHAAKPKSYHGTGEVAASMAKMRNVIGREVVNVLVSDPNAVVKVTLELQAEFRTTRPTT